MDNGASSYRRFRDNGDESGLAEIIRDYREGLILYLNSIVGSLQTAEDLAEDTFVLLGTKKPKDKGKGAFRTWLYTIGRNIAIDWLRKHRKYTALPLDEQTGQMLGTEDAAETVYLKKEQRLAVHSAMQKLPPDYRQVLWLVYFEDFSTREAAGIMKKTVRSVEALLCRARKSLKSQLESEGFDYENL